MDNKVTVTQPALPPLKDFIPYLEQIWDNKWLTNNGPFHQELEKELASYLGVNYLSLFSNGTLALITALQSLRISGEVITTPYSFVATTHSLWWNNIKPIFVDIDPITFNINPQKIESAITPKTTAIMPVHVYGNPCEGAEIQRIADTYGLKIIYDAAHAFGVRKNDQSILNWGDLSIMSFHATKVFSTIEGGAIICKDEKMKKRIDLLKNFGFADEVTVVEPGINAKMNEVQAAYGLLQLKYIDSFISERKKIVNIYNAELANVEGIKITQIDRTVDHTFPYYPILINSLEYGLTRDQLYGLLKQHDIYGRRYFYPLITSFSTYRGLDSASISNLPIANMVSDQVLCLPIYPDLAIEDIMRICSIIKNKA